MVLGCFQLEVKSTFIKSLSKQESYNLVSLSGVVPLWDSLPMVPTLFGQLPQKDCEHPTSAAVAWGCSIMNILVLFKMKWTNLLLFFISSLMFTVK